MSPVPPATAQLSLDSVSTADHLATAEQQLRRGRAQQAGGDHSGAIQAFLDAARGYERAQDFRQITALWDAVGRLLVEEAVPHDEWRDLQLPDHDPLGGLEHYVVSDATWEACDPLSRAMLVYHWAADHREAAGDLRLAYVFYGQSAALGERVLRNAEIRAKSPAERVHYHHTVAWLHYRTAVAYVRCNGTYKQRVGFGPMLKEPEVMTRIDSVEGHVEAMHHHYDAAAAHRPTRAQSLGRRMSAYRGLRAALQESGNLAEARELRARERRDLATYYRWRGNPLRAALEWCSGAGFRAIVCVLLALIAFVFPLLYAGARLVEGPDGELSLTQAVLFSVETALLMGPGTVDLVGRTGELVTVVETGLSFFGLGVLVSHLAARLD